MYNKTYYTEEQEHRYYQPPPVPPKPSRVVQAQEEIQNQQQQSRRREEDGDKLELDSYTTKKTATGGALGMGLLASNIDQLVTIAATDSSSWHVLTKVKLGLLCTSIVVQIINMIVLTVLASSGKMNMLRKRKQSRLNTAGMVLSLITTLLNVSIASFNGRTAPLN